MASVALGLAAEALKFIISQIEKDEQHVAEVAKQKLEKEHAEKERREKEQAEKESREKEQAEKEQAQKAEQDAKRQKLTDPVAQYSADAKAKAAQNKLTFKKLPGDKP